MADHHLEHASSEHTEHHVVPISQYVLVFTALMALLILTLVVAMWNLGPWSIVIAMVVAVAKAAFIVTFFMHLKWSSPMVRFFGLAALFWLLIMFAFTFGDYLTRGPVTLPFHWQ